MEVSEETVVPPLNDRKFSPVADCMVVLEEKYPSTRLLPVNAPKEFGPPDIVAGVIGETVPDAERP